MVQRVLALCEFHYCEFNYYGYSKLSKDFALCDFYVFLADAILGLMLFYVILISLLRSICLMRFLANATFSRSQKSHQARTLCTNQKNSTVLGFSKTILIRIPSIRNRTNGGPPVIRLNLNFHRQTIFNIFLEKNFLHFVCPFPHQISDLPTVLYYSALRHFGLICVLEKLSKVVKFSIEKLHNAIM